MNAFSLIFGAIVGIGITVLFFIFGLQFLMRFFKNTKLIRNYWIFVIIFMILNIIAYVSVFFIPNIDKNLAIAIMNQGSTLLFAIFTGYFAFSQVMESRFEKLDAEGSAKFKSRNYTEAVKAWESALAIKRKDHDVLCNLTEVYIIQGKYAKAESEINFLIKIVPPEKEELPRILGMTLNLFKGHISEANECIAQIVEIIKAKGRRTYYPRWDFGDTKKSPKYLALRGEAKSLFDNSASYVIGKLSDEDRIKFESGNYLLT